MDEVRWLLHLSKHRRAGDLKGRSRRKPKKWVKTHLKAVRPPRQGRAHRLGRRRRSSMVHLMIQEIGEKFGYIIITLYRFIVIQQYNVDIATSHQAPPCVVNSLSKSGNMLVLVPDQCERVKSLDSPKVSTLSLCRV